MSDGETSKHRNDGRDGRPKRTCGIRNPGEVCTRYCTHGGQHVVSVPRIVPHKPAPPPPPPASGRTP